MINMNMIKEIDILSKNKHAEQNIRNIGLSSE